ncbi:MAG TPA: carboxypeptidase regulatory-like domain-containing protein [Mycobacteriales bacterium]|jgi:hypothetical protein|nr:carboxypeptidase regulatory-like domain-containing protein [Mycobacteriales bacterium]
MPSPRRLAAAVLLAALATGAAPAYASGGSIAGTLTDATTGQPADMACVQVWRIVADEGWAEQVQTDHCTTATGQYAFTGLQPGTYAVNAYGGFWQQQFAYGTTDLWAADRFTVTDGGAVTVDLPIQPAGVIEGTVTDAVTGDPLNGVCVLAEGAGGSGDACTDGDGYYHVNGLAPGGYTLWFSDSSGEHLGEFAHDAADRDAATPVTVLANESVQVDEDLARAGAITGTVTDAITGAPLDGICLTAAEYATGVGAAGYGCTDATGAYRLGGLPTGSFHVYAEDGTGAHPLTYHPATTDPAASVAVAVTQGQDTAGVDVAMPRPAFLSGTVTAAATGAPVAGVCVFAHRASDLHGVGTHDCTDRYGHYTIGGLPGGDVKVEFRPPYRGDLLPQWAYGQPTAATAATVGTAVGRTTTGVDAALVRSAHLAGRVVNALTGAPVAGVCATVGVYDHRAAEATGTETAPSCTGADGRYEITGLTTGSYRVELYDLNAAWAWQFYPGKTDRASATPIAVTAGATTTVADARVSPAGRIEGVALDAAGHPAAEVCLDAFTATTRNPFGTGACTGADGRFTLSGFPTGSVKVHVLGGGAWPEEWAVDRTSFATATAVPTVAGGVTPLPLSVG